MRSGASAHKPHARRRARRTTPSATLVRVSNTLHPAFSGAQNPARGGASPETHDLRMWAVSTLARTTAAHATHQAPQKRAVRAGVASEVVGELAARATIQSAEEGGFRQQRERGRTAYGAAYAVASVVPRKNDPRACGARDSAIDISSRDAVGCVGCTDVGGHRTPHMYEMKAPASLRMHRRQRYDAPPAHTLQEFIRPRSAGPRSPSRGRDDRAGGALGHKSLKVQHRLEAYAIPGAGVTCMKPRSESAPRSMTNPGRCPGA